MPQENNDLPARGYTLTEKDIKYYWDIVNYDQKYRTFWQAEAIYRLWVTANRVYILPTPILELHVRWENNNLTGFKLVALTPFGEKLVEFHKQVITQYELTH